MTDPPGGPQSRSRSDRGDDPAIREARPPVPFGVGPRGAPDAAPLWKAVAAGVAAWLLLSPASFAGFLGCVLAGHVRRAGPFRDAAVGAITALAGVVVSATLVVLVDPTATLGLPVEVLRMGGILVSAAGTTPLAVYLTVGFLAFSGAFGALLGVLGGYRGSGGYGATETAHQRAIELGRAYRGPARGEVPVPDDETTEDREDRPPGRER